MTRAEAVKKLQRIFGAAAMYRVDPGAATDYEREQAGEELRTVINPAADAASKAMEERRRALLEADAEYQTLRAKYHELKETQKRLVGIVSHFKFTAGHAAHGFFFVEAQADTWEQVFTILKAKYPNGKR